MNKVPVYVTIRAIDNAVGCWALAQQYAYLKHLTDVTSGKLIP